MNFTCSAPARLLTSWNSHDMAHPLPFMDWKAEKTHERHLETEKLTTNRPNSSIIVVIERFAFGARQNAHGLPH